MALEESGSGYNAHSSSLSRVCRPICRHAWLLLLFRQLLWIVVLLLGGPSLIGREALYVIDGPLNFLFVSLVAPLLASPALLDELLGLFLLVVDEVARLCLELILPRREGVGALSAAIAAVLVVLSVRQAAVTAVVTPLVSSGASRIPHLDVIVAGGLLWVAIGECIRGGRLLTLVWVGITRMVRMR